MGTSALSGGLSGGLSFGIGELGQALGMGNDVMFKTVAHGISGGIQSAAFGGNFGAGFAGGALGNLTPALLGNSQDVFTRATIGGVSGGIGAWASGGNFGQGFQSGAYNQVYNWGMHEAKVWGENIVNGVDDYLDSKGVSFGGSIDWCGINLTASIGKGPWFQKAIQTPNIGIGVFGSWNPNSSKTLVVGGMGKSGVGVGTYSKGGFYGSLGLGLPIPITGYRSF